MVKFSSLFSLKMTFWRFSLASWPQKFLFETGSLRGIKILVCRGSPILLYPYHWKIHLLIEMCGFYSHCTCMIFFIICWSVFFYAVVCPNLDFVLLVVLKRHDIFEPLIKCFLLKLPLKILKIGTGPPGSLLNCKLWMICFGKRWRLNKLYFKLLSSHFIHFKNTMQPLMNIKVL